MASFFDLFNSTFFIFLATLLLVTALLVVYFEGKMREQNHKISSMLSLVSSLAEEFNIINNGLKQQQTTGGASIPLFYPLNNLENSFNTNENNNLINVSDDEGEDEEGDDHEDEEGDDEEQDGEYEEDDEEQDGEYEEEDGEYEEDDEDEQDEDDEEYEDEYNGDNVSVNNTLIGDTTSIISQNSLDVKINFSKDSDIKILKFDEDITELYAENYEDKQEILEDLVDLVETNNNNMMLSSFLVDNVINEQTEEKELFKEEQAKQNINIFQIEENKLHETNTELKTIHINLEENGDNLDYKKLSINKLRNIVAEKGLTNDASKLKKNEILKLLGAE
jgi:hypothetical protein